MKASFADIKFDRRKNLQRETFDENLEIRDETYVVQRISRKVFYLRLHDRILHEQFGNRIHDRRGG